MTRGVAEGSRCNRALDNLQHHEDHQRKMLGFTPAIEQCWTQAQTLDTGTDKWLEGSSAERGLEVLVTAGSA